MRLAFDKDVARVAVVTAMVLGSAAAAHGQTVRFFDITDAVPARFFDAATTAPDPENPNRLVIGLHAGDDPDTWKATDFRASSAPFSYSVAMDTVTFRVAAPAGFYVSRITYSQRGAGFVARTGRVAGSANWVVADFAANLGSFGIDPARTQTMDLTALRLTFVPVSITNAMFAFTTPVLGDATLALTKADVVVEVLPLDETDILDELDSFDELDSLAPPVDSPIESVVEVDVTAALPTDDDGATTTLALATGDDDAVTGPESGHDPAAVEGASGDDGAAADAGAGDEPSVPQP